MNETLINEIIQEMLPDLDNHQLVKLKRCLTSRLLNKKISKCDPEDEFSEIKNKEFLDKYFSSKRTEGCSEKSLNYYRKTILKMLSTVKLNVTRISTDHLREYLINYQLKNDSSKVTIDNIRRILSSFFNWLEDEDYIIKSPVRRIHKIKTNTIIKETYSDEELEQLRDNCSQIRDLAMIDLLASSGMRIGELVLLNRTDINFQERECVVFGKGSRERVTYFDARTKLHLAQYLNTRHDSQEALFVSLKHPHNRLTIGGIESRLKYLGNQIGINKVHPHKFRRTLATIAIDKGMPIEQLQKLLGHKKIDTTMHYAMVKQQNVKNSHRKYIG